MRESDPSSSRAATAGGGGGRGGGGAGGAPPPGRGGGRGRGGAPRRHHRADEGGDEPLLLARGAPTVIARDRVAGARVARTAGAGVIVLDDGFQNPSLGKDLSILVIDGRRGIGNGQVFPAGPLRAPLAAQFDRAQAVLMIGG